MTGRGGSRPNDWSLRAAVGFVIAGALARVTLLTSDPRNDTWPGYLIDEGRWTEVGREWALFGSPELDGIGVLHLVVAPAYQALVAVSFGVFGVGFASARLVSAVCGVALLVMAWLFLRRRFTAQGLFVTVAALAIQPDLLFLSRVAIPESAAMLFACLSLGLLVSEPVSFRRAGVAGLVSALALGMKATFAPVVPVLAVTALIDLPNGALSWRRLSGYLAGFAAPALLIGLVGLLLGGGRADLDLSGILPTILDFIGVKSPYGMVATLFESTYAPEIYGFVIPAWIAAGVFMVDGQLPPHPARKLYISSALWTITWLVLAVTTEYFPERYVHGLVAPLAIHLGAALTMVQARAEDPIELLGATGQSRHILVSVWLSVPLAILLAPIAAALVQVFGPDPARLSVRILIVAGLSAGLAISQVLGRRVLALRSALVLGPLVAVPLLLLARYVGFSPTFWGINGTALGAWAAVLLTSLGVAGVIAWGWIELGGTHRVGYAWCVPLVALWVLQISPWYMSPTYSIVEASRAIGASVDESTFVGTLTASSVFLGNRLRYTLDLDGESKPDVLVVGTYWEFRNPAVADGYDLIDSYPLQFEPCSGECFPYDSAIHVYRKDP
jgi:hypothetical protein